MRRAISLLLMFAMVLAPCAVAHAAQTNNHHAGSPAVALDRHDNGHSPATLGDFDDHHKTCDSGNHDPNQNCSGNCDKLQRVTSQSLVERALAELGTGRPMLANVHHGGVLARAFEPAVTVWLRPVELLYQDSQSVLRMTARFRL